MLGYMQRKRLLPRTVGVFLTVSVPVHSGVSNNIQQPTTQLAKETDMMVITERLGLKA